MITAAYQELLNNQDLVKDSNQNKVVQALQALYDELDTSNPDNSTIIDRVAAILSRNSSASNIKGLYIWGGVGLNKGHF